MASDSVILAPNLCRPWLIWRVQVVMLSGVLMGSLWLPADEGLAQEQDRFKDFEIRVIRPKYFTKTSEVEVGIQLGAIVNDSFLYTFQSNANLTYHFNEGLGLELAGAYGISLDRVEKGVLEDGFSIRPSLNRPQHFVGAALVWTPIYGKFQISGNRLAYFDFFVLGGGGMTGILYKRMDCAESDSQTKTSTATTSAQQAAKVKNYLTPQIGGGQKIYINKKVALRWDIVSQIYFPKSGDNICQNAAGQAGAETSEGRVTKSNIIVKLGFSRFF